MKLISGAVSDGFCDYDFRWFPCHGAALQADNLKVVPEAATCHLPSHVEAGPNSTVPGSSTQSCTALSVALSHSVKPTQYHQTPCLLASRLFTVTSSTTKGMAWHPSPAPPFSLDPVAIRGSPSLTLCLWAVAITPESAKNGDACSNF